MTNARVGAVTEAEHTTWFNLVLNNLYSAKTIKYSQALYIKLQLKPNIKIPKKLVITIIIIKNFHAKLKSKKWKSKIQYKVKSSKYLLQ